MKKRNLVSIILAAAMLLSGCGCENRKDSEDSPTEAQKTEEVLEEFEESGYRYTVQNDEATIVGVYDLTAIEENGEVVVPETLGGYTVTGIGEGSFLSENSEIKKIIIGKNIKSIQSPCFHLTVERFVVDSDNPYYRDINGILFSKDKKVLVSYPKGRNTVAYIVPDGTEVIGKGAFYSCYAIESFDLPDTLRIIEDEAMARCFNVETIKIPENVEKIGKDALSVQKHIAVDGENLYYCDLDGILFSKDESILIKYPADKEGTEYIVPGSVERIEEGAFKGADYLSKVILSEGVEEIGDYAFSGTYSITELVLPDSLVKIGEGALEYCLLDTLKIPKNVSDCGGSFPYEIARIEVDRENNYYTSIDGVLFTKDKKTLVKYPPRRPSVYYAIPEGVEKIEASAFENSSNIETLIIPDGVKEIGANAFGYCMSVKELIVPDSVTKIGERAFLYCTKLEKLVLSENITEIPRTMVSYGYNLKELIIPEKVTKIGESAFSACGQLKEIRIPKNVEDLSADAFSGNSMIERIYVDGENQHYRDVDGILFTKDEKTLMYYPPNKPGEEYTVPDSVITIGDTAFNNTKMLKKLAIQEGLAEFERGAFSANQSLETIWIPASVTKIPEDLFWFTSIKGIYYAGSEEDWNNLGIGEYYLQGITIHYEN